MEYKKKLLENKMNIQKYNQLNSNYKEVNVIC